MTKVTVNEEGRKTCPHYDQIRLVAFQNVQAKGPMLARSMARKAIGNEEFCMQIDAHTAFVKGWDTLAKQQWTSTENEFGILSNVPADKATMADYAAGAEKFTEVPRQCTVRFMDNGFPVSLSTVGMSAVQQARVVCSLSHLLSSICSSDYRRIT